MADVAARARRALERPEHVEPRAILHGYRRALRLWYTPALEPCRSWTAFVHSKQSKVVSRAVVWDRPRDRQRIDDALLESGPPPRIEPTLFVADGLVANVEFDLLLDLASRLRLPLVGFRRPTGGDADLRGVSFDIGVCSSSFEWRGADPDSWAPLMEWTDRMRAALQRAIDG